MHFLKAMASHCRVSAVYVFFFNFKHIMYVLCEIILNLLKSRTSSQNSLYSPKFPNCGHF